MVCTTTVLWAALLLDGPDGQAALQRINKGMIRHKTLAYVHADLRRTLTGSGIEAERQRGREGSEAERQRGKE